MGPNVSLLVLMGPYGSLFVFIRLYESLWGLCVFLGHYESLIVLVHFYGSL